MTIYAIKRSEKENLKKSLPLQNWNKEDIPEETRAYNEYKSLQGRNMQKILITREMQQAKLKNQPFPDIIKGEPRSENQVIKFIPHMDNLVEKHTIPNELSGQPIYRGSRISYGTALIKSGKKPGDTIRDPRYQSFSIDPGTATFHTARSQFGDDFGSEGTRWSDPENKFKRRKRVLLEHIIGEDEIGLYGGNKDAELEIIYPRDKKWKITDVRNEDVIGYDDESQNIKIYTVERKKKKQSCKKVVKRKVVKLTPVKSKVASKPIKKIKSKIIRKPVKKCKCKK